MENKVVILTDKSGNYYIIGQDTLDQTRVRAQEHIALVEELVKKEGTKGAFVKIVGAYNVSDDRFLSATRLTPSYVVLPSHPMPA